MTLLEILVKELPKCGGWPSENICALVQGHAGNIYRAGGGLSILGCALADDWELAEVTREQYEAALVASDAGRAGSGIGLASEWNGDGLPPVGCECEMAWIEAEFAPCKILFVGEEVVLVKREKRESCYTIPTVKFRPIRSEADRKRDEAVGAMLNAQSYGGQDIYCDIYDAIAAGKIPGIRIE